MKKLLKVALCAVVSGCATKVKITNEEVCSLDGMLVEGTTVESLSPHSDHKVHCRQPTSTYERCMASALRWRAERIAEHNEAVDSDNRASVAGFFFFIVPGVFLSKQNLNRQRAAEEKDPYLETKIKSCVDTKK